MSRLKEEPENKRGALTSVGTIAEEAVQAEAVRTQRERKREQDQQKKKMTTKVKTSPSLVVLVSY